MQHADDFPTRSGTTGPGPTRPDPTGPGDDTQPLAAAAGMRLLSAGVPLTLLMDLGLPVDSTAIAAAEGGSATWLPA